MWKSPVAKQGEEWWMNGGGSEKRSWNNDAWSSHETWGSNKRRDNQSSLGSRVARRASRIDLQEKYHKEQMEAIEADLAEQIKKMQEDVYVASHGLVF